MNKFMAMGRLTRDFETQKAGKDMVSKSSIAIQRDFKNSEGKYDVDFINIEMWGEGFATKIAPKMKKGNRVLVTGCLRMDKYPAKDGTMRTSHKITCDRFGGCRQVDFNNDGNNVQPQSQKTDTYTPTFEPANDFNPDDFNPVGDDEDIPF